MCVPSSPLLSTAAGVSEADAARRAGVDLPCGGGAEEGSRGRGAAAGRVQVRRGPWKGGVWGVCGGDGPWKGGMACCKDRVREVWL